MPALEIIVFWFRRDLRLTDNAGLYHALKSNIPVLPLFIFDKNILDPLPHPYDQRLEFIYKAIEDLQKELTQHSSSVLVKYGAPLEIFKELTLSFNIKAVFTNHDYESYARERDTQVKDFLNAKNIAFHTFKDQVIFEKEEILNNSASPYTVFTPYSRKWKEKLNSFYLSSYPTEKYFQNFLKKDTDWATPLLTLKDMGFVAQNIDFPAKTLKEDIISQYGQQRNYPALQATSRLGVHLRFGTISIRKLVRKAQTLDETFLNELIWRDFYMMVLWHFPHVEKRAFKKEYDAIAWRNNEQEFKRWCEGTTGYAMVDAGMRELNETGYMHNRLRMITASFLSKHLLIDWRWGEAYFAQKLLDYDLAANNGGWQWAAGSGCDAAPYFRIFNPTEQAKKFDQDLKYIKKWVPELNQFSYPQPIVDHKMARERALAIYKEALQKQNM